MLRGLLAIAVIIVVTFFIGISLPWKTETARDRSECQRYVFSMEEWIRAYGEQEQALIQCQKDLITAQEELNHDSTCSSEECIVR